MLGHGCVVELLGEDGHAIVRVQDGDVQIEDGVTRIGGRVRGHYFEDVDRGRLKIQRIRRAKLAVLRINAEVSERGNQRNLCLAFLSGIFSCLSFVVELHFIISVPVS